MRKTTSITLRERYSIDYFFEDENRRNIVLSMKRINYGMTLKRACTSQGKLAPP